MNEILLIDKPTGISSFGVVARVRRQLSIEVGHKVKVGHTGTLDPFATGLLILLIGKATKRSDEFLKLDKEYKATVRLGANSTTGDIEGEIKKNDGAKAPKEAEVRQVLGEFVGEISQKVPKYSAVKINGRRAYDLARKGMDVEMPVRKVQIYELKLVSYKWPDLKIKCKVSSGTYIRALGEDIGKKLGVGGYLTELRRTKIGKYKIEDAEELDLSSER